jgi:N-acetylglucosamine kinase-like BadF-type ATPase
LKLGGWWKILLAVGITFWQSGERKAPAECQILLIKVWRLRQIVGEKMKWVLGVDGGGTKTTACAADMAGNVIGRIEKGPSNYHVIGLGNFAAIIAEIIDELCRVHKLDKNKLIIASLGLAGADRPGDREKLIGVLTNLGLCCQYLINSDAKIALAAGLGEICGIVLIAGTGSIAYGINKAGQIIRAGGWGHIVSDEGSGYYIGRLALVRSLKSAEGRDRPTAMLPCVMKFIGTNNTDGIIEYIYRPDAGKAAVAALSEVVAACAAQGDESAVEILAQAADELAELVMSVLNRGFVGEKSVRVCTYGGVISNMPILRRYLAERLTPRAELIVPVDEPVLGAIQLGLSYIRANESKAGR